MTDKKNIERLFQEKFKDFEMAPAPEAWDNIASRLEKKENKKRIFPFWFNTKAAGIAAAFVLGFFGLYNYSNGFTWQTSPEKTSKNTVVLQENTTKSQNANTTNTSSSDIHSFNPTTTSKESSVATISNPVANTKETSIENSTNTTGTSISSKTKVKSNYSYSKKNIKPSVQYLNNENAIFVANSKKSKEKSSIAAISNKRTKSTSTVLEPKKSQNASSLNDTPIAIANGKEESPKSSNFFQKKNKSKKFDLVSSDNLESNLNLEKNNKSISDTWQSKKDKASDALTASKEKNSSLSVIPTTGKENSISLELYTKSTGKESNDIAKNNTVKEEIVVAESPKNATLETLNNSATAIAAVDSAKTNALVENPLEKILKEKEQQKVAKNTEDKKEKTKSDWHIKPTVAPIFMFAKNGSPIDSKFADNAKTYNNTFSVGIGVEKRLSDRFYFRTSVNNLELSYNTNDIAYHSTLNFGAPGGRGLGNVSVSQSALFTTIEDSNNPAFNNSEVLQDKKEGYLNQKISYVEIPMEVSYKIVNKRLGIQIMTGLSTLFLNKNQVSLISDNLSSELGEANNLNVVHFSTNIGLGFKYKIFNALEASVEPTLKYQLFTFHTNAGGFKPYIVGLYSGVSYRF